MKHLPKHLTPRWRYLAVELRTWPDGSIGRRSFQRHVWYAAQNLVGDAGSAAIDCSVVQFREHDCGAEAIVRVHRGEESRGRAVLACLDQIGGDPIGVRVRGISGTVRACEEKYMGSPPERTAQRHVAFEGEDRTAEACDGRIDISVDGAFVGATPLDI